MDSNIKRLHEAGIKLSPIQGHVMNQVLRFGSSVDDFENDLPYPEQREEVKKAILFLETS